MIAPPLHDLFEANRDRYIAEWKDLLAFPTVSADPDCDRDCAACADWLVRHLRQIGFDARPIPTAFKPLVFAERRGRPGKPVVLFYSHYDVQPVDPLDQWLTPPFQPTLKGDRLFARGAEDNKGQLMAALKAMETLIARNALDATVKVIIEGEEESGGRGITESLPRLKEFLKADILMVADTGMAGPGIPTLVMGLRGIIHLTVLLEGPRHDLHSGLHGGVAPNPATELARLIATLHHPDGRIAVEGFYDSLPAPTDKERTMANAVPFTASAYLEQTGVSPLAGEKPFTPAERLGFRPCLEVNGMVSGYGGPGMKTIIPSRASAKISARLAAGQDPRLCLDRLIRHLKQHAPAGLALSIPEQGVGGAGFKLDTDSPVVRKAGTILESLMHRPPVFLWEGASIPIVSTLSQVSGAEPLLVGFGLEEDKIHAPNESYSLEQFRLGYLYTALFLSSL